VVPVPVTDIDRYFVLAGDLEEIELDFRGVSRGPAW
jgi:hypothetical protein